MKNLLLKIKLSWQTGLSEVLGMGSPKNLFYGVKSQEERAKRINNTVSKRRTQMTKQFAKSRSSFDGFAGKDVFAPRLPKGFTIIELLIATSVFGLLLTIALAGFTGVGNIFYKGVAITQTQSSTSQLVKDITSNIQTASAVSTPVNTAPGTGKGYWYFCAGGVRYSYLLQREIDPTQDENLALSSPNMGMVKDVLPSSSGCGAPCVSGCSTPFNAPQEMLTGKMRLMDFRIEGGGNQLYNVYVTVAYGDDEDFNNVSDATTIECKGGLSQQKFCAVNQLSTSVYQGLHS